MTNILSGALRIWLVAVVPVACGEIEPRGGMPSPPKSEGGSDDGEEVPLAAAKLLIEHNASDNDTGFQGFADGEPWRRLELRRGDDGPLLAVEAKGSLRDFGLTELFFETNEPPNDEVPIADVLARLPPGEYSYEAKSADGGEQRGTALLTHLIPAGPEITSPVEDAAVDPANTVIDWEPVTTSLTGGPVTIVAYQVIVEKEEEPHPHAFAERKLSLHVGPGVTSVTVPEEFLEGGAEYSFEVLAIEESGNQTITESSFVTTD